MWRRRRRRTADLNAGLRQVEAQSQPLPPASVGVAALAEGGLQGLQLGGAEGRAAAALVLLVAMASLLDEL